MKIVPIPDTVTNAVHHAVDVAQQHIATRSLWTAIFKFLFGLFQ